MINNIFRILPQILSFYSIALPLLVFHNQFHLLRNKIFHHKKTKTFDILHPNHLEMIHIFCGVLRINYVMRKIQFSYHL